MTDLIPPTVFERYVAVDLHKAYVMVGGVNARQEVVLPPRRLELDAWPRWAKANLKKKSLKILGYPVQQIMKFCLIPQVRKYGTQPQNSWGSI